MNGLFVRSESTARLQSTNVAQGPLTSTLAYFLMKIHILMPFFDIRRPYIVTSQGINRNDTLRLRSVRPIGLDKLYLCPYQNCFKS